MARVRCIRPHSSAGTDCSVNRRDVFVTGGVYRVPWLASMHHDQRASSFGLRGPKRCPQAKALHASALASGLAGTRSNLPLTLRSCTYLPKRLGTRFPIYEHPHRVAR